MDNQAETILDAAIVCISKNGYANVSMRNIANEAGVALSQLNYHFSNKEGLFKAVFKKVSDKYILGFEEMLTTKESVSEKVQLFTGYFKEILDQNPEDFRLIYDFSGLALWSPTFKEVLNELFENLSNMIEQHILEHLPTEYFKGYSKHSISNLIIGAMFGSGIQYLLEPTKDLNEMSYIMKMLLD